MSSSAKPLEAAQSQFNQAAAVLGLDPDLAEFLRHPMREIVFTIPLRLDDGRATTVRGYRIQYNSARGPCSGGLRWHSDQTLQTGRAMAEWMTWRTALMDLPLGGASGGLVCDSKKLSDPEKERAARGWLRAMAHELGGHRDVISPDIYTTPQVMAWMLDEYEAITGDSHPAVITGKPTALGGTQGHLDAVARGGVLAVREASRTLKVDRVETFAIQGFGNAGQHIALLHPEILGGGKLVAVADTSGGVCSWEGIPPRDIVEYKRKTGRVAGFPGTNPVSGEDLLELGVDVLYPAALAGVINHINAGQVQARIVCEVADGGITPEADTVLHVKGVHVIPNFLASAGGITMSYFEQVQGTSNCYWSLEDVHRLLDQKMTRAFRAMHEMHRSRNVPMRLAACLVAVSRVAEAVRLRGWV